MIKFKTFLRENTGNLPAFYIEAEYEPSDGELDKNRVNKLLKQLMSDIKEKFSNYNGNIKFSTANVSRFYIKIELSDLTSDMVKNLDSVITTVSDIFPNHLSFDYYIECNFPLAFPLETNESMAVTINVDATQRSLKNIDKQIKHCPDVDVYIDLHGETGLLALVKLKNISYLTITILPEKPNLTSKLTSIINKHRATNDMLACQEELIENGLEEYAKL